MLLQRTVGDEAECRAEHSGRRRHRSLVEDTCAGQQLPQPDQQHRAEQTL